MSAPEYHASTDARTVRRVASAATVPSRSWLATCLRCRAYVLLVACRSGEHLHGPIVAAESARHPALSPITAKLLSTDRVSCVKYCWRLVSSVHKHSTCLSIVYTASVMSSVDNIRRGSHAVARDVYQQAPTQMSIKIMSALRYFLLNKVLDWNSHLTWLWAIRKKWCVKIHFQFMCRPYSHWWWSLAQNLALVVDHLNG